MAESETETDRLKLLLGEMVKGLERLYDAPDMMEWGESATSVRERAEARQQALALLTRAKKEMGDG